MSDEDRGKIRNRKWAARLRDFSGLRFGKITPTDIDGFLDFNNKVFIFIEAKYGNSLPPIGQRLALERLCDACEKAGKLSLVIIASHKAPDDTDIDCASIPVAFIRLNRKWRKPHRNLSVREAIEDFLGWSLVRKQ